MANNPDAKTLAARKLGLLRDVLETTRQELLLVELDALAPLLERKDLLIGQLTEVDRGLEALAASGAPPVEVPGFGAELTRLVEAILENQRTMEGRMAEERKRLRKELQDLDHESRVRGYLERQKARPGRVDLTR